MVPSKCKNVSDETSVLRATTNHCLDSVKTNIVTYY